MSASELDERSAAGGGLEFFADVEPSLFDLQRQHPVASSLEFYRVLFVRNLDKILRELFAPVRVLVDREHPGLWPTLVREYAHAHPPRARDPNWFGEHFCDWLVARREAGGELSAIHEELADYQFTRFLAASGPDLEPGDEGFERRLFVRHYRHPVAAFVRAILRDPAAALPDPRPVTLLIFRSLHPPFRVGIHAPALAELAALARRQALELPPALAALAERAIADADARMVDRGMLPAR